MHMLPKPDVILTHESDLDGLVSGVLLQRLARRMFNEEVRLEAYHYNTWRQREPRELAAWVADLSFEARLDKSNWVIIDHHTTDITPKKAQLIHDLNKSAGLLCYELSKEHDLGSPELDRLIHLNNVADLFLENDPDFVLANDYANLVKVYQFWNAAASRWDAYAYVTTEGAGGGIQILDLTQLPAGVSLANTWTGVSTSHTDHVSNINYSTNVSNNPSFPPILYISGSNKGGLRFVSLANPTNLTEIGFWTGTYSHDTYAHVFTDARANQCSGNGRAPADPAGRCIGLVVADDGQ